MSGESFRDRVDPEALPLLDFLPVVDLSGDIPTVRERVDQARRPLLDSLPPVLGVSAEDRVVPGFDAADPDVPVRIYRSDEEPSGGALCFIHGGGMVLGSVEDMDWVCRRMVARHRCVIASVEYRLAPEHPYPAALHDCYAALVAVADMAGSLGVDRNRIAVGGVSAGGGLAAATAILARDRGELTPCLQWLIYPMLDDRNDTASAHEIVEPHVWNRDANRLGWDAYLGELAGSSAVPVLAAPGRATAADLGGLAPAYIDVGELDLFRDESIAYAASLLAAGVPTELHVTPGAFHGSEALAPTAPSSRRIAGYRNDVLARFIGPTI